MAVFHELLASVYPLLDFSLTVVPIFKLQIFGMDTVGNDTQYFL